MHLRALYGVYTCMYCNSGAGRWASTRSRAASRSAAVLLSALPGRMQSSASPFKCQNAASPPARSGQDHRDPVHRPITGPAGLWPVRGRLRQVRGQPSPGLRRAAVPGPLGPVRAGGAGVRPPGRLGRPHPGCPHPGRTRPESAAGRQAGGRATLAGPVARHARPGWSGSRSACARVKHSACDGRTWI